MLQIKEIKRNFTVNARRYYRKVMNSLLGSSKNTRTQSAPLQKNSSDGTPYTVTRSKRYSTNMELGNEICPAGWHRLGKRDGCFPCSAERLRYSMANRLGPSARGISSDDKRMEREGEEE